MKAILIIILSLCIISLSAQNVGIGTSNPKAKLHVKSDQGLVTAFYDGFNEGVINPAYHEGDRNWRIITDDPIVGSFGVSAPSALKNNETAILSFTINTPIGKDVRITFSASHNDPGAFLSFSLQKPGSTFFIDHQPNLKNYSTNFIATSNPSTIKFKLEAEQNVQLTETFLDEIKVTYIPDPVLMIEDGTQMSGGILQSDAFGNTSWVDLRSEIDQQINGSIQELGFDTITNKLNIENGNIVSVSGLSNTISNKLSLSKDTIIASPGMHILIPASQNDQSAFHYDADRGSLAWGIAPTSTFYKDALYSVRWGSNNKVYAEHGSVWGQDNIIAFSGTNASVFGINNHTWGFSSTVWGKNNTIESDSFGTVWGRNNLISGKYGTVWGHDNIITNTGKNATVWGTKNNVTANDLGTSWGNSNLVTGYNSTSWGQENTITVSGHHATTSGYNNYVTGFGSMAWGGNNRIEADSFGTVWGKNNIVTEKNGTAWGQENVASNQLATAFGFKSIASGNNSFAAGFNAQALGDHAVAIGKYAKASSLGEIAFGYNNVKTLVNSTSGWDENDMLFSIGNGYRSYGDGADVDANNAFSVLKNGFIGINNHNPENYLDVLMDRSGRLGISIVNESDDVFSGAQLKLAGYLQSILFKRSEYGQDFEIIHNTGRRELNFTEDGIKVMTMKSRHLGIRESDPDYDLHLGNNSAAKPSSSSWIVASDRKLKQDIKPFEGGLDLVKKINPVWFTYNGRASMPQETGVGTIAQELERVAPYMVTDWERDGEKYKAVDYGAMDFILVNAIKEQQKQIETLMEIVEKQGKIIDELKSTSKKSVASN